MAITPISESYSFSGDTGKCNVGLATSEGVDGSMDEDDFLGASGEVGFTSVGPVGGYFRPLGSAGD
jgi:hypothetical protein